jgi:hypothetical protein
LEAVLAEPGIVKFVDELRAVELTPDGKLLDFVARNIRPEVQLEELIVEDPDLESLQSKRLRVLTAPSNEDARERLLSALRSDVLRKRDKFDLDWMLHLMEQKYGPLDWRNAFAHSLYWSSWGDKTADGRVNNSRSDAINNARFVLLSLQNLVTRGRMTLWPDFDKPFRSYVELTPDTRYIPYLYDQYMQYGKEIFGEDPDYQEGTPGSNFMTGFVTNMQNWIELLYLEGGDQNLEMAQNYYAWLRHNNPHPDGSTQEQYLLPLEEYVLGELKLQMDTYRSASAIVGSFVRKALKQFALGQIEPGLASLKHAATCHKFWESGLTGADRTERRSIATPAEQFRNQIETFIQDPQYEPLAKARLWRNLPLEYRQFVYDRLLPVFEKICAERQPAWSRERTFPEPPGMEEARKRPEIRGADRDKVEEGTRYKE